jgi:hypothetical protein
MPQVILPLLAVCCVSRRTLILIFGATLMPFGYIPSFRKMRLILVVGVFGTL